MACPVSKSSGGAPENGGNHMMPLAFAAVGEENLIRKVGGSPEMKKHLEDMGFVAGGTATVVAAMGGNIIVKVKDTPVAIIEEMAPKIMI